MSDEQHKQDLERASNQNNFADVARNVEHSKGNGFLPGFMSDPLRAMVGSTAPGKAVFGSTDFGAKDLDLNAMIDLVEQTAPEDLESSGKALWDARDAIQSAADELRGRIERVKWKGQAGTDFQKYGRSLVQSTDGLSEFAGKAGDQISAAAVGLASVRAAMPKRDPRNLKRPESYSEAEKTEKKDEYEVAVKVEKDRQEAINQMNRLASYYAVSSQQLSVLQEHPPTFRSLPTMGMPPQTTDSGSAAAGEGAGTPAKTAATTYHAPTESQGRSTVDGVTDTRAPEALPRGRASFPDDAVGTSIDSVDTLLPTTTPATGNMPPVTGTLPTTGGQPSTFDNYAPMVQGRANGKTTGGVSGPRTPVTARGRTQAGPITPANGRTGPGATNQMGRPTATGQPIAKGTGSGSRSFPMGQSGVHGGTPRPGGTAAPRTNTGPATGAGRANGVVGGRPAATGGAVAKGGQQTSRGTVIGAGPHAGARPSTGSPGQRGVFGAPQTGVRPGAGAAGVSRGGATAGNRPVTGNPAGRNSAVQAERNGMTHGGAGLVRRPGKGKPGDERDAQGSQRPDSVVEDEQTHLPDMPRRDVPPVVN